MPRPLDLVLVTERSPRTEAVPYVKAELEPLLAELAKRGVAARLGAWDDPKFDWSSAGLAVIRTTWNYHHHLEAFLGWLKKVPRLLNPPQVVAWNARKTYLRDLEQRGIPIVPTEWLERDVPLEPLLERRGWDEAVLKPTVSGGAFRTKRFRRGEAPQALLGEILSLCPAMLQPYLASVETTQERSLVYFHGRFSHAVRRHAPLATGLHGGVAAAPEPDELELAARVLATQPTMLYARVDLARDAEGQLRLMELELIEPSLFLDSAPGLAERFAEACLSSS